MRKQYEKLFAQRNAATNAIRQMLIDYIKENGTIYIQDEEIDMFKVYLMVKPMDLFDYDHAYYVDMIYLQDNKLFVRVRFTKYYKEFRYNCPFNAVLEQNDLIDAIMDKICPDIPEDNSLYNKMFSGCDVKNQIKEPFDNYNNNSLFDKETNKTVEDFLDFLTELFE